MKILQINSLYNYGSTGKIVYDLHQGLKKDNIESIVCYGRGKKVHEDYVYKICSEFYSKVHHFMCNVTGVPYEGFFLSTKKLIKIIEREKPDIVHLQCINGYFVDIYRLIDWLKNNKIKTVLTLHAEFMFTGGCGYSLNCRKWLDIDGCINCYKYKKEFKSYFFDKSNYMWKKMIEKFRGFDKDKIVITSVSPWLCERAKQSYALRDFRHITILNGVDTSIFHSYSNIELLKIRKVLQLNDEKIVFHVTPFFNNDPYHIKGGYYILRLAEMLKKENIKIIVAGPYDKSLEVPNNVLLLGEITNQIELAKYYSLADITVLTSKKETFSMVTAESLSCGTPIVGFKAGAPEMIAIREFSKFVDYGDLVKLKMSIMEYLSSYKIHFDCKTYSKEIMINNYENIYKQLIGDKK